MTVYLYIYTILRRVVFFFLNLRKRGRSFKMSSSVLRRICFATPQNIGSRARICKPFKGPRNRFPAWRAGMTAQFVASWPVSYIGWRNRCSESIPGLLKRLQIRFISPCQCKSTVFINCFFRRTIRNSLPVLIKSV
jgi:hypothetical protein